MPTATLSFEALQLDSEGNLLEGAYKLKLEGNFKQYIESFVTFIKAAIPSSDRTYEPSTREWFYHEKYHPLIEQALKGTCYTVKYAVTREEFVELKRKQDEWARQAGQQYKAQTFDTQEDITKFWNLLMQSLPCSLATEATLEKVKNWTKEQATKSYKIAIRFFHPDLHPERAAQAAELNEVWTRLKKGYYIK